MKISYTSIDPEAELPIDITFDDSPPEII